MRFSKSSVPKESPRNTIQIALSDFLRRQQIGCFGGHFYSSTCEKALFISEIAVGFNEIPGDHAVAIEENKIITLRFRDSFIQRQGFSISYIFLGEMVKFNAEFKAPLIEER